METSCITADHGKKKSSAPDMPQPSDRDIPQGIKEAGRHTKAVKGEKKHLTSERHWE